MAKIKDGRWVMDDGSRRPADEHRRRLVGKVSGVTGDRYFQTVNALAFAVEMLRHYMPAHAADGNETVAYFDDLILACQGKPPLEKS